MTPNTDPDAELDLNMHTYILPIEFDFGTVNFILSE